MQIILLERIENLGTILPRSDMKPCSRRTSL